MALTSIPLPEITINDLQSLVENKVRENKVIEYKKALPGKSDRDKKEFLADISAFANASGGDVFFGIHEEDGIASDICGVEVPNLDAEKLRIESMLRDGVEPRIPGIALQEVPLSSSKFVLIIRVPRSWAMPHRIVFKASPQFYSRNSAGKYPLDTTEIRSAFVLSATTSERIKHFRIERLSKIVADEVPVSLGSASKAVLHIVPIRAFDPAAMIDLAVVEKSGIEPIAGGGYNRRYNFDGIFSSTSCEGNHSYVQMFRDGTIEAVDTFILRKGRAEGQADGPYLFKEDEPILVKAVSKYLMLQQRLSVEPPLFIMLSYLGVLGYTMYNDPRSRYRQYQPIDRDTLLIPEVVVEHFNGEIPEMMRPIFDALWNAVGQPSSLNYDEDGKWLRERET